MAKPSAPVLPLKYLECPPVPVFPLSWTANWKGLENHQAERLAELDRLRTASCRTAYHLLRGETCDESDLRSVCSYAEALIRVCRGHEFASARRLVPMVVEWCFPAEKTSGGDELCKATCQCSALPVLELFCTLAVLMAGLMRGGSVACQEERYAEAVVYFRQCDMACRVAADVVASGTVVSAAQLARWRRNDDRLKLQIRASFWHVVAAMASHRAQLSALAHEGARPVPDNDRLLALARGAEYTATHAVRTCYNALASEHPFCYDSQIEVLRQFREWSVTELHRLRLQCVIYDAQQVAFQGERRLALAMTEWAHESLRAVFPDPTSERRCRVEETLGQVRTLAETGLSCTATPVDDESVQRARAALPKVMYHELHPQPPPPIHSGHSRSLIRAKSRARSVPWTGPGPGR